MLGYPVITAYYQVSVRFSLTLPSASFSQLLTKVTLPQLMDRSISAHKGLEPFALTSCPAHIEPEFGLMACGEEGIGRYPNEERIVDFMCAVHDVRVEGSSPSWADIERSIS